MTLLPTGTKVHLAFGYIDMRKGMDGLALLRGRTPSRVTCSYWRRCRANLIKIVYWDGSVPIHQAPRIGCLPVAVECRARANPSAHRDAVISPDRGYRLALA